MADQTAIEWCDSTFNPWIGCTKISPACDHCYASVSTPARRFGVAWGSGQPRRRTAASNWALPLRWNATPFAQCPSCGWRGEQRHCVSAPHPDDRMPTRGCPVCRAAGVSDARRRVFCASLADVFDNEVDPQWHIDMLQMIAATPNLDWLLLTKRIGNAERMLDAALDVMSHGLTRWRDAHWSNVWLGATICNQAEADRDIPKLLEAPAAVRFLSMEPLLGPVDLTKIQWPQKHKVDVLRGGAWDLPGWLHKGFVNHSDMNTIDWVIVGGESGPKARPMHPDWVRGLRDQCAEAGVPFMFKQWGEHALPYDRDRDDPDWLRCGYWGAKPGRWININGGHGFHGERVHYAHRIGKKAAGRMLDGREHSEFPVVRND